MTQDSTFIMKIDPMEVIQDYFTSTAFAFSGLLAWGGTSSTFFEPTKEFISWFKENYGSKLAVDCGCGLGATTKALREVGMNAVAIDLHPSNRAVIDDIFAMDSVMFSYIDGMIPFMCRPSRGDWIHATIIRAVEGCGSMLYVGKESHFDDDLAPLPYKVTQVFENAGMMGENVWMVTV